MAHARVRPFQHGWPVITHSFGEFDIGRAAAGHARFVEERRANAKAAGGFVDVKKFGGLLRHSRPSIYDTRGRRERPWKLSKSRRQNREYAAYFSFPRTPRLILDTAGRA
jgi:hypothetical protein